MICYRALLLLIITLLTGCSHHYDPILIEINTLTESNPQQALARLDSIDSGSLSTADRHFYDFLTIKASDKDYIKHTSDSLVLDVIDYMNDNADKSLRAEALYYGGRVYSDMGDYPRAIQYFQNALGCLPSNASLDLRANMLSQTGRLLNHLRLNDEAASYLEKVVSIDKQLRDTVNLVYDLQLLGHINLNASNIAIAEKCFKEALGYCYNLSPDHEAKTKMYIAETKRRTGRIDSALIYTRNILNDVKPATRNLALSFMTKIYKDADMLDSAYFYAKQLVESDDDLNKQFGYYILLAPEVRPYSTTEEINRYIDKYRYVVESMFNDNQNRLALEQIAGYNYDLQQRDRVKAEQTNSRLKTISITLTIVLSCFIASFFFQYQRKQKVRKILAITQKELQRSRYAIDRLKKQLEHLTSQPIPQTEQEQREELRDRVLLQYEATAGKEIHLHDNLQKSPVLEKIRSYIRQEKSLSDKDQLWSDLKKEIDEICPTFKTDLVKLTAGKLTEDELKTALLIKCGIKTTQLTKLLDITKSGIMSRRQSLSIKIFGHKISTKTLDGIIRLL